jgi:hypothetical protein
MAVKMQPATPITSAQPMIAAWSTRRTSFSLACGRMYASQMSLAKIVEVAQSSAAAEDVTARNCDVMEGG